jgi:outer membrane protein assembly factor BamB
MRPKNMNDQLSEQRRVFLFPGRDRLPAWRMCVPGNRWLWRSVIAAVLVFPVSRALPEDADPPRQKPAAEEARGENPQPADAGDTEKTATENPEDNPEKGGAAKEDAAADGPAAAGTGGPARMPLFQRFGGRMRMIFAPNGILLAAPMAAEQKVDDDSATPRGVVLPDNGEIRRRLEKIRGEISEERFADAARHLGQFLQNSEVRDFFLSHDDQGRDGRGFRAEVRRLIATLPAEGRAAYRAQFEAVARQQLNAAIAGGGEAALRDVARRFPSTKAGCESLYRLGQFLWDHGRPEAAASCLERLRGDPDAAAFEPAVSVLLAASLERAGQGEKFRAIVEELAKRELDPNARIAGRPLANWLRGDQGPAAPGSLPAPGEPGVRANAVDWLMFRGDPARNRFTTARPPLLAARWTHEITGDPQTQLSIERTARAHRQGAGTHIPLLHPLAIGDLVLMQTNRGVAAFDLEAGQRLWQFPGDDDWNHAGIDQRLWREPAGGALSADAECFYLVEGADTGAMPDAPGAAGVLSAREHFSGRQGRLRWKVGGPDGGAEPALAGVSFLGPPLPWQGRLYVEIEHRGAISVVELDARSGRVEWQEELALVDETLGADPVRKLTGATPSLSADEMLICPTSGGAIIAVDPVSRSLAWAYRYKIRPPPGSMPDLVFDESTLYAPGQDERWLDGAATLGGDCVVLSPPESAELHCLDLRDGHPRWTAPREDGLYIAGLTDEAVVVVGRSQVRAFRRQDGRPAWNAPVTLPVAVFPSGRGVVGRDGYFLPVTNGSVLLIHLKTGSVVGEYRSGREIALGNLIWHKGSFLSLGPDYLQAFNERETLERQVRERLDRNPADAAALLGRGELELAAGRLDEALNAFRQAHTLAPSGRTKSRLTATLLDALRHAGAGQASSNPDALARELDQLAESR